MCTIDGRTSAMLAGELASMLAQAERNGGENIVSSVLMYGRDTKKSFIGKLEQVKGYVKEEQAERLDAIIDAIASATYYNDDLNVCMLARQIGETMDFMQALMTHRAMNLEEVKKALDMKDLEEADFRVMTNIENIYTAKYESGMTTIVFVTKSI